MNKIETTYALVNAGVVDNIIVCDEAFAELMRADYDAVILATGTPAYIGGAVVDGAFVPQPVEPVA